MVISLGTASMPICLIVASAKSQMSSSGSLNERIKAFNAAGSRGLTTASPAFHTESGESVDVLGRQAAPGDEQRGKAK